MAQRCGELEPARRFLDSVAALDTGSIPLFRIFRERPDERSDPHRANSTMSALIGWTPRTSPS
jgi:hypothetical protein